MKKMIVMALLAFGIQAAAFTEVVECDLRGQLGIEKIKLESGSPAAFTITYTNNTGEILPAMDATAGLFQQIHFSSNVRAEVIRAARYAHTKSAAVGDVYMQWACLNRHSDIYCNSRGGVAEVATVSLNIGGQVVKFNKASGAYCSWSMD